MMILPIGIGSILGLTYVALGPVDWTALPVGTAAILGLVYVVRSISHMVADNNDELYRRLKLQAERDEDSSRRDERRDGILTEMAVSLALINEQLRSAHWDTVQVAETLKKADARTADKLVAADEKREGEG